MSDYQRQTYKFINLFCGILFTAFTFCYLFFYQSDLLAVMQNIYSKGQTSYNSLVGAILIALTLLLVHFLFSHLFKDRLDTMPALTYIPSALLLTLMTGGCILEDYTLSQRSSILTFVISIVCYIVVLFFIFKFNICFKYRFTKSLWCNILLMSVIFLYVCAFSNNNRIVHVQAHVEQCLINHNYKDALSTMKKSRCSDLNLTTLKVYALSCEGLLPECLFEYNPVGTSKTLLPNGKQTLIFSQKTLYRHLGMAIIPTVSPIKQLEYSLMHGSANRHAVDYLLCGYLLDGNLNAFAKAIGKYYEINDSLPKHYKEALILYRHLYTSPSIIYKNNVMDADFIDYQKLEEDVTDYREKKNKFRDVYGNTYWYYFEYVIS